MRWIASVVCATDCSKALLPPMLLPQAVHFCKHNDPVIKVSASLFLPILLFLCQLVYNRFGTVIYLVPSGHMLPDMPVCLGSCTFHRFV